MEQEKTMSILQQEILCKQHQIETLDRLLIESKQVALVLRVLLARRARGGIAERLMLA